MKNLLQVIMIIVLTATFGCSEKSVEKLSPKEVTRLYIKARKSGDTDTLRKILYMAPEISDKQRDGRLKSIISGSGEKKMLNMFFGRTGRLWAR